MSKLEADVPKLFLWFHFRCYVIQIYSMDWLGKSTGNHRFSQPRGSAETCQTPSSNGKGGVPFFPLKTLAKRGKTMEDKLRNHWRLSFPWFFWDLLDIQWATYCNKCWRYLGLVEVWTPKLSAIRCGNYSWFENPGTKWAFKWEDILSYIIIYIYIFVVEFIYFSEIGNVHPFSTAIVAQNGETPKMGNPEKVPWHSWCDRKSQCLGYLSCWTSSDWVKSLLSSRWTASQLRGEWCTTLPSKRTLKHQSSSLPHQDESSFREQTSQHGYH